MSDTGYGDRGNKDVTIANPRPGSSLTSYGKESRTSGEKRTGEPFLIGDAMTGGYGTGADILHECTIAVDEGQIAVIVGPNGAGKSTAMKAVFGMLNVRQGAVRLAGEDITRLTPQARVAKVAVGRALMTRPKVLMLDEPTAGVSPIVMDELFDRIIEVARTGISILMVEQNARQALEIADKGYVLVQGRNAFTDTGKALLEDPEVRKSFLGG